MKGKCFSAVNRGQRKISDYYQTPYSMTRQLLEVETFQGECLEPCAGGGAIVRVLCENNIPVIAEYNKDFLVQGEWRKARNIVTNPPFSLALEFIKIAKNLAYDKIAMLLPLSYLHGQRRFEARVFDELKKVYVFTRYPLLTEDVAEDYDTGMIAYAWYIWKKGFSVPPTIGWIDNNKYVRSKRKQK